MGTLSLRVKKKFVSASCKCSVKNVILIASLIFHDFLLFLGYCFVFVFIFFCQRKSHIWPQNAPNFFPSVCLLLGFLTKASLRQTVFSLALFETQWNVIPNSHCLLYLAATVCQVGLLIKMYPYLQRGK